MDILNNLFVNIYDAINRLLNNLVGGLGLRPDAASAIVSAVMGLLALCGLPMLYHPAFNVPRFALASRNRFFLCIEAADPLFDARATAAFLESLEPKEVSEVAP